MTVVRIKHQENYVIINKTLLEDKNLSFKAKGLWAYCMSRPNHWEFHVSHLSKVSKDKEDAVYSALRELEKEGYVKKVQQNKNGKFGPVDYEISEIKIILPLPGFPDAGFPDAGNPALVSNDIEVSNEKTNISLVPPVGETTKSSPSEKKKDIPKEAVAIAEAIWSHVQRIHPKHKAPNLEEWAETVFKCHRIDQRSWFDLWAVVKFVTEIDKFWAKTMQSPESLRRNFDKISLKMLPADPQAARAEENLETARKVKNILAQKNESHLLIIEKNSVSRQSGDSIPLGLLPETFEDILLNWFQLRKKL